MTVSEANTAMNEASQGQPWWLPAVGTYGIPAVLMMLWYFQVYKPDQDTRRELDRANATTLTQMGQTMQMLVDQDRRREIGMSEVLRNSQEQTRLLQQIMIDQRNGAWNQPKPTSEHSASKPEPTIKQQP